MKIKHLLIGMLAIAGVVACKQDEPVQEPKLDVDKATVEVAATAGEASFNVTSNQNWVATADADWVSIEPASGAASEKAVAVKVTAEDNETAAAREATVTVKAGELTKTVKVNQAAGQGGETPGPELQQSEWALVGTFGADNNWNPASELYLSVLDEEYFVYYGLELATDSEFKFLKGGAWPPAGQEVGGNGLVEPNTIQPAGGSNIKVTEAGKYDIYLAADLTKFYIMSEGKLPAEAVEPAPVENQWGMMGCFVDNQWATDVPMTKEGEWIVAKGAQFTELTFKIRANASWADGTNIGRAPGSERAVVNGKIDVVTAEYAKANLGGDAADIKLNGEPGTYDVYFSFENLEVYVMEAGFKPGEKEPQNPDPVEVTYTVVGTIADAAWVNNAEIGLMAKEGDYLVAKNIPFVWNSTCYGGDYNIIEFKILETGTWDGFAYPEKNVDQYANAEIKVQIGGENIALNAPEGSYDVYFDKANLKVWVMEPGFKPGEKEPLVPQPEPEYTLDGKQWMAEVEGMQVLFDFGLAEEGMLSVGMPSMDGTGFGLYMAGLYEIVPADATSGVINFTQYDWEWDEFADPVEMPYSELTATTVKAVSEGVFGTTEPISFTLVENPYEIAPPQTGGDGPSGAIENGEYWFFNGDKVMAPLAEGETTGVLPAGNVIDGASTVKNIFTLTYDPDWTYYTIQDSYGRYLGQTDETGNITVTDVLPTDDTYAFYLWAVETGYGEACSIYNASYYYDITYSAADNKWVLVDGGYEFPETLPVLVKAENPVEEPVVPQAATIASVLALGNGATIPADTFVEGFVISNMDLNNLTSKKGLYIQDETAGLQFYLAANHTFKFGDKVKVDLSGAKVGEYGGAVQISGLDLAKIEVLSSGNVVEPKTVAIADFLANKYEGQYVAVENVQVAKSDLSKTWVSGGAHTSINIEDADGNKFVVFSSKYATYGTSTVSQGAGTLKGIASINNGKIQLIFAQNSDYAGLTGTRFGEEVVEPEEPETPVATNRADFETFPERYGQYTKEFTSAAGWHTVNCAIQEGYTTDINPQFICIGKVPGTDTWAKAVCINGKTTASGVLESPELAGGCGTLSFNYGNLFSEANGVSFKVEVIQNGSVVKELTFTKDNASVPKLTKLEGSLEVNVSGTFKLRFTNLSPTNSTSNKDRVSLWNMTWTSFE